MRLIEAVLAVFFAFLSVSLLLFSPGPTAPQRDCPLGYGGKTAIGAPSHQRHHITTNPDVDREESTTLYTNCTVLTSDPDNPRASAFAVRNGRFVFVGGSGTLPSPPGSTAPCTKVVDLKGAIVVPGFIDSHVHIISGGLALARTDLRHISSKESFVQAVHEAAQRTKPGDWILGGNWDESKFAEDGPPSAAWIDDVSPHHPVFLVRFDAHQGLANSLALRKAGIEAFTEDPPGGVIFRYRDSSEPSGLIADAAMAMVTRHIPAADAQERRAALKRAEAHALAAGVTTVGDMGRVAFQDGDDAAWDDLEEVYTPAANEADLKLRIRAFVPLATWRKAAERVQQIGDMHPGGHLYWGGVKEFYDGSLGSRTALMHRPYADDASNTGIRTVDVAIFKKNVIDADEAGLQVAVHAIGDKAVDEVLDVYERIHRENRSLDTQNANRTMRNAARAWRHRIEHVQHVSSKAAAQRFAALGVVTTPNPLHLLADADILAPSLGSRERVELAYPFGTLKRANVKMAFATDWPVVELDLLETIRAAVQRTRAGDDVSRYEKLNSDEIIGNAEERISVSAALAAVTRDAAFACFMENEVGMVKAGLRADFVVLREEDMSSLFVQEIGDRGQGNEGEESMIVMPKIDSTYVDGICRFGCIVNNSS